MARMTEEEAWALDEEVTKNPPRVAPFFSPPAPPVSVL